MEGMKDESRTGETVVVRVSDIVTRVSGNGEGGVGNAECGTEIAEHAEESELGNQELMKDEEEKAS